MSIEHRGNDNPKGNSKYAKKSIHWQFFTTYSTWTGSGLNSGYRCERLATDHMTHDPTEKMLFATDVSAFQFVPHNIYFSSTERTSILIRF
jgi:hypothetical protein